MQYKIIIPDKVVKIQGACVAEGSCGSSDQQLWGLNLERD